MVVGDHNLILLTYTVSGVQVLWNLITTNWEAENTNWDSLH